jgi:crotonobetainyl-CoA hydratase
LLVTIDRPEVRNAVDSNVARGLAAALELADSDSEVRVMVLTGAGNQAFCAGADLRAVARGDSLNAGVEAGEAAWGFAGYVNHPIRKPTIAAVNGAALGGGTELVLASDLAIASETATFGLPEVTRGLMAGGGGAFRLPRTIPRKLALELLLTGDRIDAPAALRLGLINRVVPADRVLDEALRLAQVIAANAPLAVQASKQVATGVSDGVLLEEGMLWSLSDEADAAVRLSKDAAEGAAAFLEKRAPVWSGD